MSGTTSDVIKLQRVRLSFPKLWNPKAFREGQKERYEASYLLDPSNEKHAAIIDEILEKAAEVAKAKFNGKVPKKLKFGFGYADGDEFKVGGVSFRSDVKEYDGYEGMFYVSCANTTRPVVVDRDGRTPLVEADARPYAGCYVNGNITLWGQDNEFGQRVNCNLRSVQFVKDGEAFGVKPVDAEEEFDEVEDLDEEDEDDIPY